MPKSDRQKLKLLLLRDLLMQHSDAEHPISMQAILDELKTQGVSAERKSVYSDLQCLQEYGMDILLRRGKYGGYFLASREFELPELKLLVDAVQSSRFLTEKKSVELISKLEKLASSYEAGQLRRQVVVSGRVKSMSESIYYNVDRIHEAIARNSRIRFRYFDWGPDRERHYRPRAYLADPIALCWADENYYLIADSERHGITHYRVDKMDDIRITGKPRRETPERANLCLTDYAKSVFSMFGGEIKSVRMRFHNSLAGVVLDRFGQDSILAPDGPEHFTFTAKIAVSPMFLSWLAGFGGRAKILFPEDVAAQYVALLRESLAQYSE